MSYKRTKNSRQHGSHTHGWGSKKKHRGAGHRGGRGNAGSGKRGDARKPSFWGKKNFYGKHGFTPKNQATSTMITLSRLSAQLPGWILAGKATQSGSNVEVNLEALGFTKLLSTGAAQAGLKVVVPRATARAVEKIQGAKGSITQTIVEGAKAE